MINLSNHTLKLFRKSIFDNKALSIISTCVCGYHDKRKNLFTAIHIKFIIKLTKSNVLLLLLVLLLVLVLPFLVLVLKNILFI